MNETLSGNDGLEAQTTEIHWRLETTETWRGSNETIELLISRIETSRWEDVCTERQVRRLTVNNQRQQTGHDRVTIGILESAVHGGL